MDKPISEATRAKIDALCESIARKEQLGAEVQDELRGHIEDKVAAYLEGKEPLTEADALVLARIHFGAPAEIKSMLQDVHVSTFASSLGRRIVFVALTLGIINLSMRLLLLFTAACASITSNITTSYWTFLVARPVLIVAGLLIFRRVLRSTYAPVQAPCYEKWSLSRLSILLLVVAGAHLLVPITSVSLDPSDLSDSERYIEPILMFLTSIIQFGTWILGGLIWIAWCDRPPRTTRAAVPAAIAWGLFHCSTFYLLGEPFAPVGEIASRDLSGFLVFRGLSDSQFYLHTSDQSVHFLPFCIFFVAGFLINTWIVFSLYNASTSESSGRVRAR